MANQYLQFVIITLLVYCIRFELCKSFSIVVEKSKPAPPYAPEKALARDLLAQYANVGDPLNGRPVEQANETVTVTVGLTLVSILDVNEQGTRSSITMFCWIEHVWKDPFLKWDPSDNGVSVIQIFVKDIWTPDGAFLTNRGKTDCFDERSKAMVYPDGEIFWSPACTLTFDCQPVDQDTLKCSAKYLSWTSSSDKVLFKHKSSKLDLLNYVFKPGWEIVTTEVLMVDDKYTCCIEPYNHLIFQLELKRKREDPINSQVLQMKTQSRLESSSASTGHTNMPVYFMIFIVWILRH